MVCALQSNPESHTTELEKDVRRQTLDHIRADLRKNANAHRTAEQIVDDTGLSKATVRWYLNCLIGANEVESQVDYSIEGRLKVGYRS